MNTGDNNMILIILDKNPITASRKIPDKIKFKQLLELCQLICSAGISDVYKPVKQGKELAQWVYNHKYWVQDYLWELIRHCKNTINMKPKTRHDIVQVYRDLCNYRKNIADIKTVNPQYAVFRYSLDYKGSKYKSKTELPIDKAIEEYENINSGKVKSGVYNDYI